MTPILKEVIQRARKSPFYFDRLSEFQTWSDLPVTTKEDLRAQYPFGLLAVPKTKVVTYHESSGTEGKPISSYFSEADWKDVASRFLKNAIGLNSNDVFFIKTPYSMVTTAHQAQKAAELAGALVVPGDNRTTNMPYSRVVQLLKDLSITVTWSLPTEIQLWAVAARRMGLDPQKDFPNLRAFWVAGEPLSPSRKKLLSQIWGGKEIFEDYGSTETGSLAGQCKAGKLHAWADRIHFEILNPETGEISLLGKGILLVTPLYREAMPLIRYQLDDEVSLESGRCNCGSSLPTIEIQGRRSSELAVQGKNIFASQIEECVLEAGMPFGVSFWRAYHSETELQVECSLRNLDGLLAIQNRIQEKLRILSQVFLRGTEDFVPSTLFEEKLKFAKPQFVFKLGKKPQPVHYF